MSGGSELLDLYRENRDLRAENEELRRQLNNRSPPRIIRSRSRSPPRRSKKIPSETDLFIGNFFGPEITFEKDHFFGVLRERYEINCLDVRRLGNSVGGRLVLETNEDQTKFLDNREEICRHFGLNNISIYTIKK